MEEFDWIKPFSDDIISHFQLRPVEIEVRRRREGEFGCHGETRYQKRRKDPEVAITIWIGITSEDSIKRLIVHELAHVGSLYKKKGVWTGPHDDKFYNLFWSMAKYAKLNLAETLGDEVHYKPRSAVKMAVLHNIPGAVGVSNRLARERRSRAEKLASKRKKAKQAQEDGSDQSLNFRDGSSIIEKEREGTGQVRSQTPKGERP